MPVSRPWKAANPVDSSVSLVKNRKAILDSLLLKSEGVTAGEMAGLYAYFVNRRMFACISGSGVGVCVPASTAADLQLCRGNVIPLQPNGVESTSEWIQINHENSRDYQEDLEIFMASIEFVRAARS